MKPEEIALILRQLRLDRPFTQHDLADLLGVDTSTVTHIENGSRKPSLGVLFSWVEACGGTIQITARERSELMEVQESSAAPRPSSAALVDPPPELPKVLRRLRSKNGFNQRRIAALIGVDQSFIAHIERGQRDPSFDTLQRWLAVCKARLIIIDLTETPTGLTPEEERLISASRVLDPADMARATDVAEMFGRVDGIPAEIIRSQVDGFVRTLRNYIPKSVR